MYKPNNYLPPQSTLGNDPFQIRSTHVNNLLSRYPNARIVMQDKTVIDVPVLVKNNFLNFRILLHPPFPHAPPIIKLLATAAEHRFLDRNQLVVHDRLRMWHANDHLGDAAFVVFQDFVNNPPRILSYAVQNTRNTPSPNDTVTPPPSYQQPQSQYGGPPQSTYPNNNNNQSASPQSIQQQQQQQQQNQMPVPPIPDRFSEIEEVARMDPKVLKGLLESEWQFKEWFDKLGYVQTVQQLFEELRAKNMEIAKENIKRNDDLEAKTAEWKKLTEELQQLKLRVQDKQLKQKEVNERYQPQNVLRVLNQKINDVEEESEELGDRFARSGANFEEFQRQYMEKRALFHLRQEKKVRFTATYVRN